MAEAARRAGITRQAIEQAIARGVLPSKRIAISVVRILPSDLDGYILRTGGKSGRPPDETT